MATKITALKYASVIISLSLLIQLTLSMKIAEDAFRLSELKQELKAETLLFEIVLEEVSLLQSISIIHREAVKLGMVPSQNPKFIDLKTHKVLG